MSDEYLAFGGSLADYLRALEPALPPTLVSTAALRGLIESARELPVMAGGMERTLGGGPATVDWAVCMKKDGPALRHVLAWLASAEQGSSTAGVRAFFEAAADPGSVLAGRADDLWLEWDASAGAREPSLYFEPDEPVLEVVDLAARLTMGTPLSQPQRRWLERQQPLPGATSLFSAGWMLGRPTPTDAPRPLRLCFSASHRPALEALLARMCGPEVPAAFRETLNRFIGPATRFALMLSLADDRPASTIGLELAFAGQRRHVPVFAWAQLLAPLVEAGLCTPSERDALLTWPGTSVEADDPSRWPPNLSGLQVLIGPYRPCLWRGIHHIKLVAGIDGRVQRAKAYFGWLQGWIAA